MEYLERTRTALLQARDAADRDRSDADAMLDWCLATERRARTCGAQIEAAARAYLYACHVQRLLTDALENIADAKIS